MAASSATRAIASFAVRSAQAVRAREEGEEVLHRQIEIERRAFGEIAKRELRVACGRTGSRRR